MTSNTGGTSNSGIGGKIRGAFQVVHGIGENIRGTTLGAIDTATHVENNKYDAVAESGRSEIAEGIAKIRGQAGSGNAATTSGSGGTGGAPSGYNNQTGGAAGYGDDNKVAGGFGTGASPPSAGTTGTAYGYGTDAGAKAYGQNTGAYGNAGPRQGYQTAEDDSYETGGAALQHNNTTSGQGVQSGVYGEGYGSDSSQVGGAAAGGGEGGYNPGFNQATGGRQDYGQQGQQAGAAGAFVDHQSGGMRQTGSQGSEQYENKQGVSTQQ